VPREVDLVQVRRDGRQMHYRTKVEAIKPLPMKLELWPGALPHG
jgi:hypothetical protein